MKKLLFLFAFILISCSDNKKENLYNIIDEILIDEIEMGAKDLDLEIVSLKKDNAFTANDSIEDYLKDFNRLKKDLEKINTELGSETLSEEKVIRKRYKRKRYYYVEIGIRDVAIENEEFAKALGYIPYQKEYYKSIVQAIEKKISSLNLNIKRLNLEPEKIIFNNYEIKLSIIYNPFEEVKVKKTYKYIISFGLDNRVFDYDYFESIIQDFTSRILLKDCNDLPD